MTTPCPYCGAENPDTCLECRTCQRHLPARTLQIAPRRFSPVTGLRLVLFLAALAALVLILLTPEVPGEVDEAAEVDLFYRQLVAMEHAVRKKNEYSWTVREGDANAYLSAVVQEHELHRKGSWRRLVLARVDFQDGAALLTLHHQWGPVVLSQQINLSPPKTGEPSSLLADSVLCFGQASHPGSVAIPSGPPRAQCIWGL